MQTRVCLGILVSVALVAACSSSTGTHAAADRDSESGVLSDVGMTTQQLEPDGHAAAPQSGLLPIFDLQNLEFFDSPYPSDLRRTADGHLDLSAFPNPADISLLTSYIQAAESFLTGFSLIPAIVFRFEGPLDLSTLPSLEASWQPGSSVVLVDVDQESIQFGRRFPVQISWWGEAPARYLAKNSLTAQPLFGTPLREGTTYACLVLRTVHDVDGAPLAQHPLVADGLAGLGSLASLLQPVTFWLQHGAGIAASDIATATVFTTDTPTAELRAIANYVQATLPVPAVTDLTVSQAGSNSGGSTNQYDMYEGHYLTPNFQRGEKPYAEVDGDIVFDANGLPIVQDVENLRFALAVPKGDMPANGWPLVLYGHGTGGDWKSFAAEFLAHTPARELAKRGIASMGIDQPLHGTRYQGDKGGEIINSFNFFNVAAARANFRQSAADVLVETRVAREALSVPAAVSQTGADIRFDPDNVFFFGHSHGGISGALMAPFSQHLKAIVLSGAGGGLSHTTLRRKDLLDIEATLRGLLQITDKKELTLSHPVLALMQNLVDITDPLSYAPLYRTLPGSSRAPINILLTEGTDDQQTPSITTDNLAAAAEMPILAPAAQASQSHEIIGLSPVSPPVSGNFSWNGQNGTAVLSQFEGGSHFSVFHIQAAVNRYTSFIQSAIENGIPTVQ